MQVSKNLDISSEDMFLTHVCVLNFCRSQKQFHFLSVSASHTNYSCNFPTQEGPLAEYLEKSSVLQKDILVKVFNFPELLQCCLAKLYVIFESLELIVLSIFM